MILLTKEIFIKLKQLINLHVNLNVNESWDNAGVLRQTEHWQIYIQGLLDVKQPQDDSFNTTITYASKEEAYRVFADLVKQIIDSGEVTEFQAQLFNEVLTDDKKG